MFIEISGFSMKGRKYPKKLALGIPQYPPSAISTVTFSGYVPS
jgi:hypothetical protein